MGQEVDTKIALIVARDLGVNPSRVKVEFNNTTRIANSAPTAASSGSDLNGHAAHRACMQIKKRLKEFAAGLFADSKVGTACRPGGDGGSRSWPG